MATTPVGDTSNALDPRGMHPVVTNLLVFPEGSQKQSEGSHTQSVGSG